MKPIQVLIRGWIVIGMAAIVIFFPGLAANIVVGVFMILSWVGSEMTAIHMSASNDVVSEQARTSSAMLLTRQLPATSSGHHENR
jgi:hypothetical protein